MKILIEDRPMPVPLFYQPVFKEFMIVAILKYGTDNNNKATITKLHVYAWALRNKANKQVLIALKQRNRDSLVPWAYEPAIEKALILTIVDKFCTKVIAGGETYFQLTDQGESFLKFIEENELFKPYLSDIIEIGKISEAKIRQANTNWKIF